MGNKSLSSNEQSAIQGDIFTEGRKKILFHFKSYKEYSNSIPTINTIVNDAIDNINKGKRLLLKKVPHYQNKFYDYLGSDISREMLFEIAIELDKKIRILFPEEDNRIDIKNEFSKINYPLLCKYCCNEYNSDDELCAITDRIIKRINFFIDEFPFKLNFLFSIIKSKKIYVFAYDKYLHLNFYIEPFSTHSHYYIQYKMSYIDYMTYIFFLIEHILPSLIHKFNFNPAINITIDFHSKDIDTELITFILSYFDRLYPHTIHSINLVNFNIDSLQNNITFISDIENIDFFRVLLFHNENYKMNLISSVNPNCLPINYGGYHSLHSYFNSIIKCNSIEQFIQLTIDNILINPV